MDPVIGLKVLVVEDHVDIREALVAILEGEGYDVSAVDSAEAAMRKLREGRFNLLVTDYCLPVKTGTWLIDEALSSGILERTRVLMITAHPRPQVNEAVRVMRKPLDVDDFVNEVSKMLAADRQAALEKFRTTMATPSVPNAEVRKTVELVLYISSASHSSLRALRNIRRLLERYAAADVGLTVHDLSIKAVPEAEEDRIAFTPTLVRRYPGPRAWILGDLADATVVSDLLSLAGVEEKK